MGDAPPEAVPERLIAALIRAVMPTPPPEGRTYRLGSQGLLVYQTAVIATMLGAEFPAAFWLGVVGVIWGHGLRDLPMPWGGKPAPTEAAP